MGKNKGKPNKSAPKNHGGGTGPNPSAGELKNIGKGALGKTPKSFRGWTDKKIRRMARKTARSAYRPAMTELRHQRKEINSIDRKRALDNKYYLEWLDEKSKQLSQQAATADSTVRANQQEIQNEATQRLGEMRQQLIDQFAGRAGTVSQGKESIAFDVTPEAAHGLGQIANERDLTESMVRSNAAQSDAYAQSNFAHMAAAEATRKGEHAKEVSRLRTERNKLRLEQAAAEAAEIARLLTQEIDKGKARVDMRNMAASQALAQQAQNLEQKKYRFDVRSTNRKFSEAKKQARRDNAATRRGLNEENRHNRAQEKLTNKGLKQDAKEAAAAGKKEQKEASREITTNIEAGITWLKTSKGKPGSVAEATRKLAKNGMNPLLAKAAAELAVKGKLSKSTAAQLQRIGYLIPGKYK